MENKIDLYLKKILSKNQKSKNKYKSISNSTIRYAGGKTKAGGLILENFPKNINKVVSIFFGGGSFETILAKELNIEVIGYDIFSELVNFWNIQINNPNELYNELIKLIPDKENYTKNRHILLNYWEKIKPKDLIYKTRKKVELSDEEKNLLDNDNIKRAAYYYYNHQLSFGPMFLGWPSSNYLKEKKYKVICDKIKKFNIKNLSVQQMSFEKSIPNHPNDFLFLDPPYMLNECTDSKMFKGIYPNSNFAIHHNKFNHILLRDLLYNHKGGFILTYNDCTTIREWYKNYKQVYPKWQYTYGQGETRIGKNRKDNNTNIKESHEIFIICYPNSENNLIKEQKQEKTEEIKSKNEELCKFVLTRGKNKGNLCNKKKCKRHKIEEKIEEI